MPQATYESKRGSAIESAVGGLTASVFSAVYILAPLWIIAAVVGLVWMPSALATRILVIPLAVSILIPPMPAKWLLQQWPLQCIPKYFQYREVLEIDDAALEQVMNSRAHIFTAVPHGVISYGAVRLAAPAGLCATSVAAVRARRAATRGAQRVDCTPTRAVARGGVPVQSASALRSCARAGTCTRRCRLRRRRCCCASRS